MRALSRAIDRFCAKHRKFGVPRLIRYIVFISAAIFLISLMDRTGTLLPLLGFHPGYILRGQVWRLVTWVFLPLNDNLIFTALMLYFYYFIGNSLEQEWGMSKFTVYYLFGVFLNIIYGFIMWYVLKATISSIYPNEFLAVNVILSDTWFRAVWLSPNFLNLSMFFAFAALFPDHRVLLFFFIPVKMKWLALINACFFLYSILRNLIDGLFAYALLPIIALLNFIIICGDDVLNYIRPHKARYNAESINFRKAAKQARREQDDKNYRHKCAVCGKTDTEYPNLEFRYCSRCSDYHCFCTEHINNHIHFK